MNNTTGLSNKTGGAMGGANPQNQKKGGTT